MTRCCHCILALLLIAPIAATPAAPKHGRLDIQVEPVPDVVFAVAEEYSISADLAYIIVQEAQEHGIPVRLLCTLIYAESQFCIHARSRQNANGTRDYGLMQLNSANYEHFKVVYMDERDYNILSPQANVHIGASYLADMYKIFGNWTQSLAAYNAGMYAAYCMRVPKSTVKYVRYILSRGV